MTNLKTPTEAIASAEVMSVEEVQARTVDLVDEYFTSKDK